MSDKAAKQELANALKTWRDQTLALLSDNDQTTSKSASRRGRRSDGRSGSGNPARV